MLDYELPPKPERHPFVSVFMILLSVALGFVVIGPLVGFFLALPFYPGTAYDLGEALGNPDKNAGLKVPLYIMQGCATFIGLVVTPAVYLKKNRSSITAFFREQKTGWLPLLLTMFLVLVSSVVNSIFIEWNAHFHFPEFAKGFEEWARESEDKNAVLTELLTTFGSPAELGIGLLVIAILPAIGEEIVFRGMIQKELYRGTKNIHFSIWLSAILFSAIHLQFFGFVPRMLLGALFGYIYYWSGNLWLAIFAHFVNNGASVLALYFYQRGSLGYDVETPEAAPAHFLVICAILTAGLLFYFQKYFEDRKPFLPQ